MATLTGFPTDGAAGSVATEAQWRKMAREWLASGVLPDVGAQFAPSYAAATITCQPGAVWIDGHYAELTVATGTPVTSAGILVVRFTVASNLFELVYRDAITVPTQTTAVWEMVIASMAGGVMTDRRIVLTIPGLPPTNYRKTTPKIVNTTTAEVDLFAGEFTVGAGVMGTNKVMRITTIGLDHLQNSTSSTFTWRLKFGGTTVMSVVTTVTISSANRGVMTFWAECMNAGAANAQVWHGNFGGLTSGGAIVAQDLATGQGYTKGESGGALAVEFAWQNTSTVDTSSAQPLALTVQMSNSHANIEAKLLAALIEIS